MDTTEQLNGTYFYKGLTNLTAGELFFFVFLEEAQKQLGATPGTSILSENLRRWLKFRVHRWPTLTNESIRHLRFSYVNNLDAFTGRWIPILGIAFVMNDVVRIGFNTLNTYNLIAREDDRIW